VQLREVTSPNLRELLDMNNVRARTSQKWQYLVLTSGTLPDPVMKDKLTKFNTDEKINEKLTPVQRLNIRQNLQLIGMEEARKEGITDDTVDIDDEDIFS
jgi:Rad3-related DNA helicase